MHKVDKLLTRKELGSFSLNGKTFKVLAPTVGQLLTQMEESEEYLKQLEELHNAEKYREVAKLRYKWMKREVEIFFPGMTEDELNELTVEGRDQIFEIIFPPDDTPKETTKKKASRGEKK